MPTIDIDPASLNLDNLREITDGDASIEKELFDMFLQCGNDILVSMTGLAADGEQDDWKEYAHSLKGQCANLGAGKLAALAHDAQMASAASKADKEIFLSQIKAEWEVITGYLKALSAV